MSHTTFTDGVTLTAATWFNDIDTVAYTYFGDGTNLNSPTQVAVTIGTFSTRVGTPIVDSISGTLTLKGAGTTALTITAANAAFAGTVTTATLDTATAVAMSLGGTNATTLTIGRSGQSVSLPGSSVLCTGTVKAGGATGAFSGTVHVPYAGSLVSVNSASNDTIQFGVATTVNSITNVITSGGGSNGVQLIGRSLAGDPVAADLPTTTWGVFKNTGSGVIKLWYNDAGTLKGVVLA